MRNIDKNNFFRNYIYIYIYIEREREREREVIINSNSSHFIIGIPKLGMPIFYKINKIKKFVG